MTKYRIKLLTQAGPKEMTIPGNTNLDRLSEQIRLEYGDFVTLSSEPIEEEAETETQGK